MATEDLIATICRKIIALEPENALRIIGYFLKQNIGRLVLIRMDSDDIFLQNFCRQALFYMSLEPSSSSSRTLCINPFDKFRRRSFSEEPRFRGTGYYTPQTGLAQEQHRMVQRQGSKSEEIGFRGAGYQIPQTGLAHQQQRMVQRRGSVSEGGTGYRFTETGLADDLGISGDELMRLKVVQQQKIDAIIHRYLTQRQGLDSEEPGFSGTGYQFPQAGVVDEFGSSRGEMKLAQQQQRITHDQPLHQTRQRLESEESWFRGGGLAQQQRNAAAQSLKQTRQGLDSEESVFRGAGYQSPQTGLVDDSGISGGEMMTMRLARQERIAAAQSLQQTQRQGSESKDGLGDGAGSSAYQIPHDGLGDGAGSSGYQIPQDGLGDVTGSSGYQIPQAGSGQQRMAAAPSLKQRQASDSENPWFRGSGFVDDSGNEIMNLAQQLRMATAQSLQQTQRQGSLPEEPWFRGAGYQIPQAGLGDDVGSSSGEIVSDAAQGHEQEVPMERQQQQQMQQMVEMGTFSNSEEETPRRRGDMQELIELAFERRMLKKLELSATKKKLSIPGKHPQEVANNNEGKEASTTGNTLGDSLFDSEEKEEDPSDQSSDSS
ncbi:unnamed protein product [Cochlearia groenlandica]